MENAKRLPPSAGVGREPAMPTVDMTKIAKQLTHKARSRLKRNHDVTPDTQVARAAGVNRMTVQKFRTEPRPRDDMSLRLFLAVMSESGGDPAEAIAQAMDSQALAGKEAE